MNTHKFKLNSGIECEVKELIGKHQRWLTENDGTDFNSKLDKVLADVVVRIGSLTKITEETIRTLLATDRKKILVEVRQYSLDFEKTFEFNYEYTNSQNEKCEHELSIDISNGFNEKPLKVINSEGDVVESPYKELSEVVKDINIVLPKSGKRVIFSLLDGNGEKKAASIPRKSRSSHSAIMIRNPREIIQSNAGNDLPIVLDLDLLSIKDIEFLRSTIKEFEGSLDTEIMFEHPEAETKSAKDKEIVIDILGEVAFFFPSEAI